MEETTPKPCTPAQSALSLLKRLTPWIIALGILIVYLYLPTIIQKVLFFVHGAPPIVPGQENLEGSQIEAAQQAGGTKQFGAITSVLGAAIGYFSVGLGFVWFIIGKILPSHVKWAKKDYTRLFNETLSPQWQFVLHYVSWFGLLFFFALCLWAASNSQ